MIVSGIIIGVVACISLLILARVAYSFFDDWLTTETGRHYTNGSFAGRETGRNEVRREAIEKGYAHYSPKTGEFKWLAPPTQQAPTDQKE